MVRMAEVRRPIRLIFDPGGEVVGLATKLIRNGRTHLAMLAPAALPCDRSHNFALVLVGGEDKGQGTWSSRLR